MACKNCGECCCSVAFSGDERDRVKKITRGLNLGWKKLELQRTKNTTEILYLPYSQNNAVLVNSVHNYIALVDIDIPCPFLVHDNVSGKTSCACYESRPAICRKFGTLGQTNQYLYCENFGR